MSLAQKKILLGGVSALAVGSAGTWMWMKYRDNNEPQGPSNINLLGRFNMPFGTISVKQSEPEREEPEVTEGVQEPQQNVVEPPGPVEEEQGLATEESAVIHDPKKQIEEAGLSCGNADKEIECTILEGGLNVDVGGERRDGYEIYGEENGKIKFRISNDPIFADTFRFIVTEKQIQLRSKTDTTQTLTLERYENYGLVKVEEKVYLTRKLKAGQGKIKSLGLPDKCVLPEEVSSGDLTKLTCKLTAEQMKSINFEEKKNEGATTSKTVDLHIQKVSDEETYKGGYKFTFKPEADVDINTNDKIKAGVFKDFKLKNPDEDDLVLERVWKSEGGLLSKVGLSCDEKGKCTINDGSLKIKDDKRSITIEDGKKKIGNGTIYLENKNAAGYYEGLTFSVWGGEITIESKASAETTFKMEELGIFYITKEDKDGTSSFHLTRKQNGVDDMIRIYLGANNCSPSSGLEKFCSGYKNHLRNFRFFDGDGERKITVNNENPSISITVTPNQNRSNYPFGYKYSIKPSKDIPVGKISLTANSANIFKIKKDGSVKKLYLEKVG